MLEGRSPSAAASAPPPGGHWAALAGEARGGGSKETVEPAAARPGARAKRRRGGKLQRSRRDPPPGAGIERGEGGSRASWGWGDLEKTPKAAQSQASLPGPRPQAGPYRRGRDRAVPGSQSFPPGGQAPPPRRSVCLPDSHPRRRSCPYRRGGEGRTASSGPPSHDFPGGTDDSPHPQGEPSGPTQQGGREDLPEVQAQSGCPGRGALRGFLPGVSVRSSSEVRRPKWGRRGGRRAEGRG